MVDEKILEKADIEVARRVEVEVEAEGGIVEKEMIERNVENMRQIIVKEKIKENDEGRRHVDEGENGVEVGKKIHNNSIKEKENVLIVEKAVSAKSVKAEEIIETKIFEPNFNEENTSRTKMLFENNEKKFLHERNEDKIDQDYFRIDNNNNSILLNSQKKEREENEFKNHYLDLFPIMS